MELRRLIQTTLAHPLQPEFSLATLFVQVAVSGPVDMDSLNRMLDIEPISGGAISEGELKRILACILLENFTVFDMDDKALRSFVNQTSLDMDYLEQAVFGDSMVIQRGVLASISLSNMLPSALGAAMGLFKVPERSQIHEVTGPPQIELFTMLLPYGLVICGSQRGIGRALHLGLFDRLQQKLTA